MSSGRSAGSHFYCPRLSRLLTFNPVINFKAIVEDRGIILRLAVAGVMSVLTSFKP